MAGACRKAGVKVATGDTEGGAKRSRRRVYINTFHRHRRHPGAGVDIGPANALRPGDAVLVSGTVGDHGMAVMSVREGLTFPI